MCPKSKCRLLTSTSELFHLPSSRRPLLPVLLPRSSLGKLFYSDDRQGRASETGRRERAGGGAALRGVVGESGDGGWEEGRESVWHCSSDGVPPATQLQLQIKQNRVASGAAP